MRSFIADVHLFQRRIGSCLNTQARKVDPLACNPQEKENTHAIMLTQQTEQRSEASSTLDLAICKLPAHLQSEWVAGMKRHSEESSGKLQVWPSLLLCTKQKKQCDSMTSPHNYYACLWTFLEVCGNLSGLCVYVCGGSGELICKKKTIKNWIFEFSRKSLHSSHAAANGECIFFSPLYCGDTNSTPVYTAQFSEPQLKRGPDSSFHFWRINFIFNTVLRRAACDWNFLFLLSVTPKTLRRESSSVRWNELQAENQKCSPKMLEMLAHKQWSNVPSYILHLSHMEATAGYIFCNLTFV